MVRIILRRNGLSENIPKELRAKRTNPIYKLKYWRKEKFGFIGLLHVKITFMNYFNKYVHFAFDERLSNDHVIEKFRKEYPKLYWITDSELVKNILYFNPYIYWE